jgi:radical SAM protein with 4Fe4S-binding SPASM domain
LVSEHGLRAMSSLPLVTLHLTERCNSRCISCDYWRHGKHDLSPATIERLLPDLRALGTHVVLISGGEPLVHPLWREICELLHANGLRLWLHTAGLALAKHAERMDPFDWITVSLDGVDAAMYSSIRGLDAFDIVCAGIRAVARRHAHVGLRVTVQRANYFAMPQFVDLAYALGADNISFLAADVSNEHAFGREPGFSHGIALAPDDLPRFDATLDTLEREHAAAFTSGFIAESPAKLRRVAHYFAAILGRRAFPPVRCNAPEFSAVLAANGSVQPCFFIPGPSITHVRDGLANALNGAAMRELRDDIRRRRRSECERCVCSLWRDREELGRGVARWRPSA